MFNPTAKQWYERAYQLHYKFKDYKEAYATYLLITRGYSKEQEAKYALQQMENIKKSREYSEKIEEYAAWFADSFCDMEKVVHHVIHYIEQETEQFPAENRIECNLAVLSKDEKNLYCCKYGRITKQIQSMVESFNIEQKIAVIKEFIDDILSGEPVYIIPLNSIVYYQDKGDVAYSTSISGGGGSSKSMSLGGTVLGGLLFGEAGAIIGSRAGTGVHINEVQSETIEHDNRYVTLRYQDKIKGYVDIQLGYDTYDALNKLIPDKEYSYVSLNKEPIALDSKKIEQQKSFPEIPVKQLRQLKELLDDGIITQSDFDAKKKQLLEI
mgnify:FL=1